MPVRTSRSTLSPLTTDLYQLTMAYGYWKRGVAEHDAAFHLTFRECPFGGQFAVTAGLETAIEYLENLSFGDEDLRYLGSLGGADGKPLFDIEFLDYLRELQFACDVDAIPEGVISFAHEPLVRVVGPLLQGQLIETALLNAVNFQTLIATKAARLVLAADGDDVLEFGLRRAQGFDGGLSASRAAFIGGCSATSNVLAGQRFGIPVKGTHAHSWVMTFESELESFRSYAEAMPNNAVFLVDTFDTREGVRKAIEVGLEMRSRGHEMIGIRLDSGDLGRLSKEARKSLDAAGFPNAAIVASNDLDEFEILKLKRDGARIDTWGVGTRLATAYDQPALGGVYKLAAIRSDAQQPWRMKVKLSDDPIKVSNPGRLQVRRFGDSRGFLGDVIFDIDIGMPSDGLAATGVGDGYRYDSNSGYSDLLAPVFRKGERVSEPAPIEQLQRRAKGQLAALPDSTVCIERASPYVVSYEQRLHDRKMQLIASAEKVSL